MLSNSIDLMLKIEDFLTAWHIYESYLDPTNNIIGELK